MAKITIVNGPTRVEVENGTAENVGQLLRVVREEMGIPGTATPILDGVPVDEDAELYDGAELAFGKPTGQKG